MKYRIKESIGLTGKKVFIPQYFNEYKGLRILKFFASSPDEWLNLTLDLGNRIIVGRTFDTLQEAQEFLHNLKNLPKYHDSNDEPTDFE